MADQAGLAVGRVEVPGSVGEALQVALELLELGDALRELAGALLDELGDVAAGGFAVVAKCGDLPDLAEGEPDGLSGADEPTS